MGSFELIRVDTKTPQVSDDVARACTENEESEACVTFKENALDVYRKAVKNNLRKRTEVSDDNFAKFCPEVAGVMSSETSLSYFSPAKIEDTFTKLRECSLPSIEYVKFMPYIKPLPLVEPREIWEAFLGGLSLRWGIGSEEVVKKLVEALGAKEKKVVEDWYKKPETMWSNHRKAVTNIQTLAGKAKELDKELGKDKKEPYPEGIGKTIGELLPDGTRWLEWAQKKIREWQSECGEAASGLSYLVDKVLFETNVKGTKDKIADFRRYLKALESAATAAGYSNPKAGFNESSARWSAFEDNLGGAVAEPPSWYVVISPEGGADEADKNTAEALARINSAKEFRDWFKYQARTKYGDDVQKFLDEIGFLHPTRKNGDGTPAKMTLGDFNRMLNLPQLLDRETYEKYLLGPAKAWVAVKNKKAAAEAENENKADEKAAKSTASVTVTGNTGSAKDTPMSRSGVSFQGTADVGSKSEDGKYSIKLSLGGTGEVGGGEAPAKKDLVPANAAQAGLPAMGLDTVGVKASQEIGIVTLTEKIGLFGGKYQAGAGVDVQVFRWWKPGLAFTYSFYNRATNKKTKDIQFKVSSAFMIDDANLTITPNFIFNSMLDHGMNKIGGGGEVEYDGTMGKIAGKMESGAQDGVKAKVSYTYNDVVGGFQRLALNTGSTHAAGFGVGYYAADKTPWFGLIRGAEAFFDLNIGNETADVNGKNVPSLPGKGVQSPIEVSTRSFVCGLGLVVKVAEWLDVSPWAGYSRIWNDNAALHGVAAGAGFTIKFGSEKKHEKVMTSEEGNHQH